MKTKFFNPLGDIPHKITQTTHGESASKPNDLSKQQAVDLVPQDITPSIIPVYAVADGNIETSTTTLGGYIALDVGLPFYVLYVHIKPTVKKGVSVKRGDKIGEVLKGDGWHLHFGFKSKNLTPPTDNPMGYLDRATQFYATHPAIKKIWCNSDGSINWDLFIDKYIGKDDPYAKELEALRSEVATLRITNGMLGSDTVQLNKTIVSLKRVTASLEDTVVKLHEKELQLNKELANRDESIKSYRKLNANLMSENIEAQEIIASKDNLGWALSNLVDILVKKFKRFE